MHDGDYRSPDKITLGDCMLERWLPSKQTRVKRSTAAAYESNIRLHINPNIGLIPLQKLRPEDLDELYVKLLTEGKRIGDGPSAKSVRNVHATIQSALSDATRKGTVFSNVADIADPPSISRSGRSMNVWTGDQLRTFLEAIAEHELYGLYFLAATTGMRRGEIADLKTASGRRHIDLDEQTIAMLRRHRRRQLEERMASGKRGDNGFVFGKSDASPVQPDLPALHGPVDHTDDPASRPPPHTRHNPAPTQRPPKVVSGRLGHSSIAFTMTVYQRTSCRECKPKPPPSSALRSSGE